MTTNPTPSSTTTGPRRLRARHGLLAALGLAGALGLLAPADDGPEAPPTAGGPTAGAPTTTSSRRPQVRTTAARRARPNPRPHDAPRVATTSAGATWLAGQLLVELDPAADPAALHALAAAVGATAEPSRHPGLAVLQLDAGAALDTALDTVRAHPAVRTAGRHARTRGALLGGLLRTVDETVDAATEGADQTALQWHRAAAGMATTRADGVRVAVLDSGVAHRDAITLDDGVALGTYVEAPSLRPTALETGWDFVQDNATPDDDHWHGTHIATTLSGEGRITGVSPGLLLQPYRVLDHDNTGTELFLVEAIHAAVDDGAQVLNMSLSFGPDYRPSAALLGALDRAAAAGVVMVAAAGNTEDTGATWPAASRHVIGVGASCMGEDGPVLAPYSHVGSDVELYAPGGCLGRDIDENGYPDGILAETISPLSTAITDLYWAEGTSQAAAVVAGAAAHLLAEGVAPAAVRATLAARGRPLADPQAQGAPVLDLSVDAQAPPPPAVAVALLPWIHSGPDGLSPRVQILAVDDQDRPLDGVRISGHVKGSTTGLFSCVTVDGLCTGVGPALGEPEAAAWTVTLGRAERGGQAVVPQQLALSTAALDETRAVIEEELGGVPHLGFELEDGVFPGAVAALSFTAPRWGRVAAPTGAVMTEDWLIQDGLQLSEQSHGSGLASSPLGYREVQREDQVDGPNSSDSGPRGDGGSATVKGSSAPGHPSAPLLASFDHPCLGAVDCGVRATRVDELPETALPAESALAPVDLALPGELLGVVDATLGLPLPLLGL